MNKQDFLDNFCREYFNCFAVCYNSERQIKKDVENFYYAISMHLRMQDKKLYDFMNAVKFPDFLEEFQEFVVKRKETMLYDAGNVDNG